MDTLKLAQDQLVESERMASLGGLVAGIAHDVNTPIGVGVTAASFLQERLSSLQRDFDDKKLTNKSMASFLDEANQTTGLLITNLNRASDLVTSFKQVSVDQTSEAVRNINLKDYLAEITQSLAPRFKKTNHSIDMNCPDDISLYCAPGAIAQIMTNMMMNSLIHGFEGINNGQITVTVTDDEELVYIDYRDNGNGMSEEMLSKHFEAFFTTKRGKGGSGLGTHIMYNLVTQTLGGSISVESNTDEGLSYHIEFPHHRSKPRLS